MTHRARHEPGTAARRRMSWGALVAILLAYALIPAFVDVLVLHRASGLAKPDQDSVNDLAIGTTIGLGLVVIAVTAYRWWPAVLREERRTRGWVWAIPVAFLVASIGLVDHARLATAGVTLSGTLLLAALLIGASEELAFRGMVLTFMRDRYREVAAAVATSVAFGAFHILAGPLQAAMSMLFGYLLYLTRRVSGGIALPILVHAAWDFSVFSGLTTASPATDSSTGLVLALITFASVTAALIGHRAIDPRPRG